MIDAGGTVIDSLRSFFLDIKVGRLLDRAGQSRDLLLIVLFCYSATGMQTDHVTSYLHENNASSVYQQLYEIRVKLSSIGFEPGDTFILELGSSDADDCSNRDTQWGWWAPVGTDEARQCPSAFGKAKLQPSD